MTVERLRGNAVDILARLPAGAASACITSVPYWRQRDYDHPDQIGLEATPQEWVAKLVPVFSEVRRILGPCGVLWLNCGDKYAASGYGWGKMAVRRKGWTVSPSLSQKRPPPGYQRKDLILAPLLLAAGLQKDGWIVRRDVIWSKGTAIEPPVRDRPSTSHEYLFLLVASPMAPVRSPRDSWWRTSVWDVPTDKSKDHPATMPLELVRRCLVSCSRTGDTILDPFSGYGTTGLVADHYARHAILIDIRPEYIAAAEQRHVPWREACPRCGEPFTRRRSDQRTCGRPRCRKRQSRLERVEHQ